MRASNCRTAWPFISSNCWQLISVTARIWRPQYVAKRKVIASSDRCSHSTFSVWMFSQVNNRSGIFDEYAMELPLADLVQIHVHRSLSKFFNLPGCRWLLVCIFVRCMHKRKTTTKAYTTRKLVILLISSKKTKVTVSSEIFLHVFFSEGLIFHMPWPNQSNFIRHIAVTVCLIMNVNTCLFIGLIFKIYASKFIFFFKYLVLNVPWIIFQIKLFSTN